MGKDKNTDYSPTEKEIDEFIRHKNGYSPRKEPKGWKKDDHKDRGKRGSLIYKQGNYEEVIEYNKPFPLLQHLKKSLIKAGYKKHNLIIRYA